MLQQRVIDRLHPGGRPVICLHELFDGQLVTVAVAKAGSEALLVLEQQSVLVSAGQDMQSKANPPEVVACFQQLTEFGLSENAAVKQSSKTL